MVYQKISKSASSNNKNPEKSASIAPRSFSSPQTPIAHFHNFAQIPVHSPVIQAKLTIGSPNDRYEQEADRVAARVVQQLHRPSSIQRSDELDETIQAKSMLQRPEAIGGGEASTQLSSEINNQRGGGQPLEVSLQQSMGRAMGADFSRVRVHTDGQSDRLNRSIQAEAFTTGHDVFFRQGTYQPTSRGGQELIAHELTHVVQQNGNGVQRFHREHEPCIQRELSGDEKEQFTKKIQPLTEDYKELRDDKNISSNVRKGLIAEVDAIKIAYGAKDTTSESFTVLLDNYREKLDHIKEYRDALGEAKNILNKGLGNRQAQEAFEERVDYLESLLKYDELETIFEDKGIHTLYNLFNLAKNNPKKDEPVKVLKGTPQSLTAKEEQEEKMKAGPGSYTGFDVLKSTVKYKVKLWGEDYTYADPEKTIKQDIVRMYEITWAANANAKDKHTPWILHIHFTLADKLTVAHFKRYKTHQGGQGTNLTNYDGNIARMFYEAMKAGL
jgi:Domain of unknown function (DUF4157)